MGARKRSKKTEPGKQKVEYSAKLQLDNELARNLAGLTDTTLAASLRIGPPIKGTFEPDFLPPQKLDFALDEMDEASWFKPSQLSPKVTVAANLDDNQSKPMPEPLCRTVLSLEEYWRIRRVLFEPESNDEPLHCDQRSNEPSYRFSLFFNLLRYPLLAIIVTIVAFDLILLFLVRFIVYAYERFVVSKGPNRKLLRLMSLATSYETWKVAASYLDAFSKSNEWKDRQEQSSDVYNAKMIRKSTHHIHAARISGNVKELMQHTSHACRKNFGGCLNESLYSNSYDGTKKEVEEFFGEVEAGLKSISMCPKLSLYEKKSFFNFVSRNHGQTALCLSGGGTMGYYHLGVAKALFEQGMLPSVLTGASGGSVVASIICTRTDEELISHGIFDPHKLAPILTVLSDPWDIRLKRFSAEGFLLDPTEPFSKCEVLTNGHLTFLEAFQRTGRILCISVCPDEPNSVTLPKVLNYVTAPDVIISSAICASCSLPSLLPSIRLLRKGENGELLPFGTPARRWRDGSIRSDIPDLSMFNVQFQIVSQVNPHITAFFYESQGSAGCPTPHRGGRGWKGGFLASSLIHMIDLDLKKWLRLCKDLKLMPPVDSTDFSSLFLQQFEGSVTILPANENIVFGLMRMLDEPGTGDILKLYVDQGERKTWPKLGMISHRMRIENAIKKIRAEIFASQGSVK